MLHRCLLAVSLVCITTGTVQARPSDAPMDEPRAALDTEHEGPPHAELMRFLLQGVDDPDRLKGYRIAILAADGVDGFDLAVPRAFLAERGATVHLLAPRAPHVVRATGSGAAVLESRHISVLNPSGEGDTASIDRFVDQVQAHEYDAIYLPANRSSVTPLTAPHSIAFLRQAERAGTPIFAVGNSPIVLLEAGLLDDRRATGDAATLTRLASSRATGANAPLVSDGALHTSRNAFDIPVLMEWLVATLLMRPALNARPVDPSDTPR